MYFDNFHSKAKVDENLTSANYKRALEMLEQNVLKLNVYNHEVLTTGKGYPGIWLEHNHDSLFYADISPEIAKNSHRIFYRFQNEEGLFPAYICKWPHDEACHIGYGHMQTIYPLAASAYEISIKTQDEEFLSESYEACKKYDGWIKKYRNTRKTGLVEMFCGFDTGHDNSCRIKDIPKVTPYGDARFCSSDVLPIIAPDMSAMMYRAQIALSDMAEQLSLTDESAKWLESAENIKKKIMEICYSHEDEFFFDVDYNGNYRKFFTEHIFRMFVNGVVEQDIFDKIFDRYINNEDHFKSKFPFSSVSISSPDFNIDLSENNWNGKTQTHTALETLFWLKQYGREDMLNEFMAMWINMCNDSDMVCTQEVNPFTGEFSKKAPGFTTTLIMYVEFAKRLQRL